MNTVLVTAGGDQSRWESTTPKHLVTIKGETLLTRGKNQLSPWTEDYIILTDDPLIQSLGDDTYMPVDNRNVCETLVNTRHLWGKRTIILHGDTVLSMKTMRRIATDRRPCAFWGNWTDILAISVYEEEANALMFAIWSAAKESPGKLWQAYRAYVGFEMDDHKFDEFGTFIDTMDWSRDFDTVEEYEYWINHEVKRIPIWE